MSLFVDLQLNEPQFLLTKISDQLTNFYESHRLRIFKWTKSLGPIHSSNFSDSKDDFIALQTITQIIVTFMSQKNLIHDHSYLEDLSILDSILNHYPFLIHNLEFGLEFCVNIRKFFIKGCQDYEEECSQQNKHYLQFQLSSVLYAVVVMIYQTGKSTNNQIKRLPLIIMNRTFITHLLNLEIPQKLKVRKLIGYILVYIVKKINARYWAKKILNFIGNDFGKTESRRILFNYIFCLKEIYLQYQFSYVEIIRYNLIAKLKQICKKYPQSHQIIWVYHLLLAIVAKYTNLCDSLFDQDMLYLIGSPNNNILKTANLPVFLQLMSRSLSSCESSQYKKIIQQNLLQWKSNKFSLNMIVIISEKLSESDIIVLIQQGLLQELKQILQNDELEFKIFGMTFLQAILSILAMSNWHFALSVYLKFKNLFMDSYFSLVMKSRVAKLQNLFEKGFLYEYISFSLC